MSGTMTLDQAVARLGKFQTTDGLAQFLKREGIKMSETGSRANRCPLAMWFKKVLGVHSESDQVTVGYHRVYAQEVFGNLPFVATRFISLFDNNPKVYKFLR